MAHGVWASAFLPCLVWGSVFLEYLSHVYDIPPRLTPTKFSAINMADSSSSNKEQEQCIFCATFTAHLIEQNSSI
jgi:hypothetical protein